MLKVFWNYPGKFSETINLTINDKNQWNVRIKSIVYQIFINYQVETLQTVLHE